MSSGPENIDQTPEQPAGSEQSPSPLVAALQREHPEWISEVIVAFGETTFIVPREHIVAACFHGGHARLLYGPGCEDGQDPLAVPDRFGNHWKPGDL